MSDYPPNMTLRPLERWPHDETRNRRRAPFGSTWSSTISLLRLELRKLGNDGPHWTAAAYPPSVLQLALREQDFRQDGLPRASAVPLMPGVIVNIESKVGSLSYPCDTFDRWQDNLRAIALGLEALRKVGRYGITPGNEQYTGWKALPQNGSTSMTVEAAEAVLRDASGVDEGFGLDLGTLPQVYRRARKHTHPDGWRGDRWRWDRVEAAADVLRAAGKL